MGHSIALVLLRMVAAHVAVGGGVAVWFVACGSGRIDGRVGAASNWLRATIMPGVGAWWPWVLVATRGHKKQGTDYVA